MCEIQLHAFRGLAAHSGCPPGHQAGSYWIPNSNQWCCRWCGIRILEVCWWSYFCWKQHWYHAGAPTGWLRPGSHELRHSNYCSNSKSYYEIFSTTTLDYWKNYHDSFGVTHAQYELRGLLWFRFGGADSIVNNDDTGLSEHLSW